MGEGWVEFECSAHWKIVMRKIKGFKFLSFENIWSSTIPLKLFEESSRPNRFTSLKIKPGSVPCNLLPSNWISCNE